jgi:hypothetical protein
VATAAVAVASPQIIAMLAQARSGGASFTLQFVAMDYTTCSSYLPRAVIDLPAGGRPWLDYMADGVLVQARHSYDAKVILGLTDCHSMKRFCAIWRRASWWHPDGTRRWQRACFCRAAMCASGFG